MRMINKVHQCDQCCKSDVCGVKDAYMETCNSLIDCIRAESPAKIDVACRYYQAKLNQYTGVRES